MNCIFFKPVFLSLFIFLFLKVNIYGKTNFIKNDTIVLQNNFLIVKIKKKGAEIISVFNKKKSFEHIWQADKNSWNQSAPILFPIVGKLKNGKYILDNKEYKMKNHGFASFSDFQVVSKCNKKAVFKLTSNSNTLKKYPFKFKLLVKYTLKGGKILIENTVENTDNKKMYFSIGAHPGFNIPFNKGEKYTDYYLEFNKTETIDRLPLTKKKGLLSTKVVKNYLANTNKLHLNHQMFKDRAVILKELKSSIVKIKSKNSNMSVRIQIKNFPYLGIWTTSKSNMPFICIEPWYGISDAINTNGNFKNKKGIQMLDTAKKFKMKYFIEIRN